MSPAPGGSGEAITFTVPGAPRTKKNHGAVVWRQRNGRPHKYHVPSKAWAEWCQRACAYLVKMPTLPDRPYNVRAMFYRDALRGDAVGYYQGLADVLEAAGIVTDDKWFASWDGSRLLLDRKNPRVELTLTPLPRTG